MSYRWRVEVDKEKCDGCGKCISACPEGVLALIDGKARVVNESACDGVGACLKVCPHNAIKVERVEVAEVSCPHCAPTLKTTLANWPIQLGLILPGASFLKGANLLVCADCVAPLCQNFHSEIAKDRVVVMLCPILDDAGAHKDKLIRIFREDRPASVAVAHVGIPCCEKLLALVREAMAKAGLLKKVVVFRVGVDDGLEKF